MAMPMLTATSRVDLGLNNYTQQGYRFVGPIPYGNGGALLIFER